MSQENSHPKKQEQDLNGFQYYNGEHSQNYPPHHNVLIPETHYPQNNLTQNESPEEGEYQSTSKQQDLDKQFEPHAVPQPYQQDDEDQPMGDHQPAQNTNMNADLMDHIQSISQPAGVFPQNEAFVHVNQALDDLEDSDIKPMQELHQTENDFDDQILNNDDKRQLSGEEAEQEDLEGQDQQKQLQVDNQSSESGEHPQVGLEHYAHENDNQPEQDQMYDDAQEDDYQQPEQAHQQEFQENVYEPNDEQVEDQNYGQEQLYIQPTDDQMLQQFGDQEVDEPMISQQYQSPDQAILAESSQIEEKQLPQSQPILVSPENKESQQQVFNQLDMQNFIDQVWLTYDLDNSGALDFNETKRFIRDILNNLPNYKGSEFSDETFKAVFQHFDKDGSETINKAEMYTFITELCVLVSQDVGGILTEQVQDNEDDQMDLPAPSQPELMESPEVPVASTGKKSRKKSTAKKETTTKKQKETAKKSAKNKSAKVQIIPEPIVMDDEDDNVVADFAEVLQDEIDNPVQLKEKDEGKKSKTSQRSRKEEDEGKQSKTSKKSIKSAKKSIIPVEEDRLSDEEEQQHQEGKKSAKSIGKKSKKSQEDEGKASKISKRSSKSVEPKGKASVVSKASETKKSRGRPSSKSKKQQEATVEIVVSPGEVIPEFNESPEPPSEKPQDILVMHQQLTDIINEQPSPEQEKQIKDFDDNAYLEAIEQEVEEVQQHTVSEQEYQVVIPPSVRQTQEQELVKYASEDDQMDNQEEQEQIVEMAPQILVEEAEQIDEEKRSSQEKPLNTGGLDVDLDEESEDRADMNKEVSELLYNAADSHQEDEGQIQEKQPVVEQPCEEDGEEDGEFIPSQEQIEEDDPTLKDLSRITSEHFRLGNQDGPSVQEPVVVQEQYLTQSENNQMPLASGQEADDENSGHVVTDNQPVDDEEKPLKQGRGRPRKHPVVVKDPNEPKRSRGRPKHDVPEDSSMSPETKKAEKEEEKRIEKELKEQQKKEEKMRKDEEKRQKKLQLEEQKKKEKERKKKEAEKEKKRLEQEEKKRLIEEQKKAEKAERERKKKEAAEQKRKEEEAAQRAAEKAAKEKEKERKAAELAKKKAQEEAAKKKAAEALKKKKEQEEAAKRKAAEKKAAEEAARKLAEKKAKEELARKKAEEARKKAEAEEAEKQRQIEIAKKKKAAEEARKKKEAEEAARKKKEAEIKRKKAEEQKRKEKERQAAELKRKQELEAKKAKEEKLRREREAEQKRLEKLALEEAAKKKKEEERKKKKKLAEELAKKEAARKNAEAAAKKEALRKMEAKRLAKQKAKTVKNSPKPSKTKLSVALPISGKRSVNLGPNKGLGFGFGGWSDDEVKESRSRVGNKRSRPTEEVSPPKRSEAKRQKTEAVQNTPRKLSSRQMVETANSIRKTRGRPDSPAKKTPTARRLPETPVKKQKKPAVATPQKSDRKSRNTGFGFSFEEPAEVTVQEKRGRAQSRNSPRKLEAPAKKVKPSVKESISKKESPVKSSPAKSKSVAIKPSKPVPGIKKAVKISGPTSRSVSRMGTNMFSSNPFANRKANLKTLVASASKFAILGNKKSDRKKVQQMKAVDKRKAKNTTKPSVTKNTVKITSKVIKKINKATQKKKAAALTKRVTRSGRH